jgi:VCBS repeat-containing protein
MQVELVLNDRTVHHLTNQLGEGRVTILSTDKDGYHHVSFDINGMRDVLCIIHAGQDRGVELALRCREEVA